MIGPNGSLIDSLLGDVLEYFPGLRVAPSQSNRIQLEGVLDVWGQKAGFPLIQDQFQIRIECPFEFPAELPRVWECAQRIPATFHTNPDGDLCLGSPTRLRIAIANTPTLKAFIKSCVVPYFYSFACWQACGKMPFGELAHGSRGIVDEFAFLFRVKDRKAAIHLVRLASLDKRTANRCECPCGSGRRLGKCHNRKVNRLRRLLGREWFARQYQWISPCLKAVS